MKRPGRTELFLILGLLFALAVSHLPVVTTQFYHSITKVPSAANGGLELSTAPGEKRVVLDGEWEFYWKRLLITDNQQAAQPDFLIRVPDYWSKYQLNGEYLPAYGFASYRLVLETREASRPVTIYLPDFGSAYKVFINGTLASESGIVAKNPAEVFTTTKVNLYPVTLPAKGRHELVIEVATTRFSGLYMAPVLTGYENAVHKNNLRNNIRFMLFGAALFSFFVLLVWYILPFRTVRLSFWLPFTGLFVLLRIMLTTDFYGFWQDILFCGLSYEAVNPLMFFLTFAFKYLLIYLIQELLRISFSRKEKLSLFLYYLGLYLLYLFIPNDFYNRYLTILLPLAAFLMEIYAFFKIYLNRSQLKKYGLFVYWGAVLAITGLIIDCYYLNGNVYYNLSLALVLLFTCCLIVFSLFASLQAACASRELALSSAQLASAREQMTRQTEYYDALSTQINEIRAVRHDFKHFVSVLARLAEEERYTELKKFLNEYS